MWLFGSLGISGGILFSSECPLSIEIACAWSFFQANPSHATSCQWNTRHNVRWPCLNTVCESQHAWCTVVDILSNHWVKTRMHNVRSNTKASGISFHPNHLIFYCFPKGQQRGCLLVVWFPLKWVKSNRTIRDNKLYRVTFLCSVLLPCKFYVCGTVVPLNFWCLRSKIKLLTYKTHAFPFAMAWSQRIMIVYVCLNWDTAIVINHSVWLNSRSLPCQQNSTGRIRVPEYVGWSTAQQDHNITESWYLNWELTAVTCFCIIIMYSSKCDCPWRCNKRSQYPTAYETYKVRILYAFAQISRLFTWIVQYICGPNIQVLKCIDKAQRATQLTWLYTQCISMHNDAPTKHLRRKFTFISKKCRSMLRVISMKPHGCTYRAPGYVGLCTVMSLYI